MVGGLNPLTPSERKARSKAVSNNRDQARSASQ